MSVAYNWKVDHGEQQLRACWSVRNVLCDECLTFCLVMLASWQ
jgi:hypothetical protein